MRSSSPRAPTPRPGPSRGVQAASAFPIVNQRSVALLRGYAGRFTAQNGGFRPGQGPHYCANLQWGAPGAPRPPLMTQSVSVWEVGPNPPPPPMGTCTIYKSVTGRTTVAKTTFSGVMIKPKPTLWASWPASSPWVTAVGVAQGDTAILHGHWLSFCSDNHSNLAVMAVIFCQNDSIAPG